MASHDGYLKDYGIIHQRKITIYPEKTKIIGTDKFLKEKNFKSSQFDIRFHLYPGLAAVHTIGGNTILIQINKNRSLLFSTKEKSLKIEKSIFFGGQKVLNNYCIVISGRLENGQKTISWEIIKKI